MGLRYRPSAQADLADHAAGLALLANDLADIPAGYLDQAIKQWVRDRKFMPKASELAALAQGMIAKGVVKVDPHELCANGNAHLAKIGRSDIHWIVIDGHPSLEPTRKPQPMGPEIKGKFTLAEIEAMSRQAARKSTTGGTA